MKKFLTFILVLAMVLSVSSFAMAASVDPCTATPCTHAASIDTAHYDTLQEAIDAAASMTGNVTIEVLKDLIESVTVIQRKNLNLTIDGNDHKMENATIGISGVGGGTGYDGQDTITIQNFKFVNSTAGADVIYAFNSTLPGQTKNSNLHNLTVSKCEFTLTGDKVVAVRLHHDKNTTITGCKLTGGHSLLQATGSRNVKIINTEINNSKNGISLVGDSECTIENSQINTTGYGVRIGNTDPAQADVTIKNSAIDSAQPVVARGITATDKLNLDVSDGGNAFTPDEGYYPIVITGGDDGTDPSQSGFTKPAAASITIKGAIPTSESGEEGGYNTGAKNGSTYYTSVQEAINAAEKNDSDKTVKLLANSDETVDVPDGVNLDKNGYEVKVDVPDTNTPSNDPTVTSKPSTGSGISVKYNGGNSFSTSNPSVPTGVEIDGVPVTFNGTGSNFSVGCISSDAKWVTVRWNSTTVTTNFTPDGLVECTTVSIPKTGDMSFWAAVAAFFGF